MALNPDPALTLAIWIGVFGKTLVKKGVLTKTEIILELDKVKQELIPTNPQTAGYVAEIDNMIDTVHRW